MSFIIQPRAVLAAAFLALATAAHADGIEVHDAYAIAATPTAMSGAAFMTIHNDGAADRLIDVRSDAADVVQLHTHVADANGVMQMVHVEEGFELPAEGDLTLSRGGDHIMFMGLTAPFEQDKVLTVTLVFEHAGEVVVEVPVDLTRLTGDAMDHGTMDMPASE